MLVKFLRYRVTLSLPRRRTAYRSDHSISRACKRETK